MTLGGSELFLALTIIGIGLLGNLILFLNQTEKNMQPKWSASIYGIALLVLICGIITPPDIFSNIIFSGPLTIFYILILRKFGFKRFGLDQMGNLTK